MDNAFFVFLIIAVVIGACIHSYLAAKKRTEAMQELAKQMGFRFSPRKDRFIARKFGFLKHLNKGSNRYAHNILKGSTPDGEPAMIFDYHYQVSSGKTTTHYQYSVFMITLPRSFPELQIEPEGFGSRLKHVVGLGDIDFESIGFSNAFDVRSRDKKFAYDFCNAQMIEYLMPYRNFLIELDRNQLALVIQQKLSTSLIQSYYRRLLKIRSLIPKYLFS